MNMQFPAQNTQINSFSGLTNEASRSIFPSSSAELSATGSYITVSLKSHSSSSVGLEFESTKTSYNWARLNLCIWAYWRWANLRDEFEAGKHRDNSSWSRLDHHSEKLPHAAHTGDSIWVQYYFWRLVLQQNWYWPRTGSNKHIPGQWHLRKQQCVNNE